MPRRPRTPCTQPGCPNLVTSPGKCKDCGRRNSAKRRHASPWWDYGTDWQRTRRRILDTTPRCACTGCAAPRCCHGRAAATEVHHRIALRDGGTHDPANLEAVCHPCHGQRTVDERRRRQRKRPA